VNNLDDTTYDEEDDDDNDDEDSGGGDTFEDIRSRLRQTQSSCKSTVPLKISDAFHSIASNLMLMSTDNNTNSLMEIYGAKFIFSNIEDIMHFKAYDILVGEIIAYRFWPFFLPDTNVIVPATMQRLKKRILEHETFWTPSEDIWRNK
jgi:hypothetical protein